MKKLTIEIPEENLKLLQKRVEEKDDFDSVESYISDLVNQVADRLREEEQEDDISEEDEEKVKERLRNLGYLD